MSLPNNADDPVARLEAELAQEKAAHSRTAKALQSITYLHDNQAVTISSQIGIIRAQIQRHPEDIDIIQKEAKEAEDERQQSESLSVGICQSRRSAKHARRGLR
ncbi:hypothetical protein J4E82_008655 [Alternaria postmessia]|uniref:uncharacterized protein n=1 Tax=Alternaria postmessia TaxID=1187938 RepID=UPI002224853C|nr:uncharacterized protein J4E82_008655 [Alternaria postmessia]KAI5372651.1 hypothetical protein J4E82_008655 [Alternaria postmessia]